MTDPRGKRKIYCAGPLFNDPEKMEMERIANSLEEAGYATFLPQRDGLEFSGVRKAITDMGLPDQEANSILSKAIFALDVYQVADSDGLVLNMNGRVPDEGAMVEAGIAWANGKKLVIFKNDARSMICGADNPLVVGLSNFRVIAGYDQIVDEFDVLFRNGQPMDSTAISIIPPLSEMINSGKQISLQMANLDNMLDLCNLLISLFKGTA
jgi:nucleoside 2-deoxyribosyltransferase